MSRKHSCDSRGRPVNPHADATSLFRQSCTVNPPRSSQYGSNPPRKSAVFFCGRPQVLTSIGVETGRPTFEKCRPCMGTPARKLLPERNLSAVRHRRGPRSESPHRTPSPSATCTGPCPRNDSSSQRLPSRFPRSMHATWTGARLDLALRPAARRRASVPRSRTGPHATAAAKDANRSPGSGCWRRQVMAIGRSERWET